MIEKVLKLPSSYEVINEEEMTYVDGGWCINVSWWGFNVYLTHKERQALTTGHMVGGLVAGLLTLGVATAVIAAVGGIIWNYDDGYGVRIRMTAGIMTGVYSLSAYTERTTASKNKIVNVFV